MKTRMSVACVPMLCSAIAVAAQAAAPAPSSPAPSPAAATPAPASQYRIANRIGERVDGMDFDPGLRRACSSNGDGTLTVVQGSGQDHFAVLENVATQWGARTLAVDNRTQRVFLPAASYGDAPARVAG